MIVRCKFKCVENKPYSENPEKDGVKLRFEPVVSGSSENDSFFKWTPTGSLEFYTINSTAAEQFEVGKQYYIDVTSAE